MSDYSSRTGTSGSGTVATDETSELIASNKVEGTRVYNRQGENLGTVHNFMVNKRSGQVEYAVMSFGGFLGMGESYHPLPWKIPAKAVMWWISTRTSFRLHRATRPARNPRMTDRMVS